MGHFTIKLQSSHFWGSGEEVARNTERRSSPTIDLVSEPDHPPPLHLRGGPSSDLVERLPASEPERLPASEPERLPASEPERLPASEPERLPAIREGAASSGSGDDPPAQGAESSGSGARPKTGGEREDVVRFWSDLKSRLPSSSQDLVEESAKKKKRAAQVAEDEEKKEQRLVRFAAGKAAGTPSFAEKAAEVKRMGEENLRKRQEEIAARRVAEAQQLVAQETDPGPSRTIQGPYRTLHGPDWTL